jgi:hypothetical protein
VVGSRKELGVAGRVSVRPQLCVDEACAGEPFAHATGLLGAAAVGPEEPPGEAAVRVALEPRADDPGDTEALGEWDEVRLERGRGEDYRVAELAVATESRGRVVAQPRVHELPRELGAEEVELGGGAAVQRGARELLQPIAVAAGERLEECDRAPEEGRREPDACRAAEKRGNAVPRRQGPVDVERGDDRARGWGFWHRRTRLYTRCVSDGPEIFDDLYLGLQAGGALRKQRRGEELTDEEREAIGRWQQMSMWRKGLAVGAFAVGTFGLGFTLGGLVFGRRARKA